MDSWKRISARPWVPRRGTPRHERFHAARIILCTEISHVPTFNFFEIAVFLDERVEDGISTTMLCNTPQATAIGSESVWAQLAKS